MSICINSDTLLYYEHTNLQDRNKIEISNRRLILTLGNFFATRNKKTLSKNFAELYTI